MCVGIAISVPIMEAREPVGKGGSLLVTCWKTAVRLN